MGHRITTQARGKGGPTYRAPSHRYKAELKHIGDDTQKITGTVIDIEHDPARNAPIALVKLEDRRKSLHAGHRRTRHRRIGPLGIRR